MVFKSLFNRFSKKETVAEPPGIGNDGWVEMVNGRLVVHDPVEDGRYATITPEGCVKLFVNGEEAKEATAVTAADRIRCEIAADPVHFFELDTAGDGMSVTMVLTADPHKVPDTVEMVGRHQVRLLPEYSGRARSRPFPPKQLVLEHLLNKGVVFGVDEQAVEAEIAAQTGKPVVIALGQEARAPVQGEWVWRLDELSMAEAGQVIAEYTGGQPNLPRITVRGERTAVYEDAPQPPGYLFGNGTRVLQAGRLVASASGRARAVPSPQGQRVHIFPVQLVEADLEGELDVRADVVVKGSIRNARVNSTGEILVLGSVTKSVLSGEVITVRGAVAESQLYTVQPGHFVPLRAELAWIAERIMGMRSTLHTHHPITEEMFRDVAQFVRGLRRRAEQIGVQHPDFQAVSDDLAKVFMGTQNWTAIDLPTLGRLLTGLEKPVKGADHLAATMKDVRAKSLERSVVWAGRDVTAEERVHGSSLFCGGSIRTPESATLSHCDLVAGGQIQVGILSTARATAPVILRSATRMEAEEVQMGGTFEFGGERKVFERDQARMIASPNAKGQLIFKQKEV